MEKGTLFNDAGMNDIDQVWWLESMQDAVNDNMFGLTAALFSAFNDKYHRADILAAARQTINEDLKEFVADSDEFIMANASDNELARALVRYLKVSAEAIEDTLRS